MDPGCHTRYQLVDWCAEENAHVCHIGVSDRSHGIGRSGRHDMSSAVTLAATVVVAAKTVSVASNTAVRCGHVILISLSLIL